MRPLLSGDPIQVSFCREESFEVFGVTIPIGTVLFVATMTMTEESRSAIAARDPEPPLTVHLQPFPAEGARAGRPTCDG